jgi:hypothetical protein
MLILSLSAIKNTCSEGLINDEKVKEYLSSEFILSPDEATIFEIINSVFLSPISMQL